MTRIPLIIDTDPGIDDAVAIALAAALPALDVVAITAVHGNTDLPRATRNARVVARHSGLHTFVAPGAATPLKRKAHPARETHGPEGLGHLMPGEPLDQGRPPETAPDTIGRLARTEERLALCCLGPLTNLAIALDRDPRLDRRLGPVICMGGAVAVRGTMTRWTEFNWWSDPEAVVRVLEASLDFNVVPLDVTRRIAIPAAAVERLREAGQTDMRARFWAEALGFYVDFHRGHESFFGCVVNDALAVALAADRSRARWRRMKIAVCTGNDDHRGAMTEDPAGTEVNVAVEVDAEAVLGLLHERIFADWLERGDLTAGAAAADEWLRNNPR